MAKKALQLSFVDIVMGAEAEVIKAAYEARLKVDDLMAQREAAYARIAEIETEVEDLVGVEGEFVFPAPPLPVAGINKPVESTKTPSKKTVSKTATVEEKKEILEKKLDVSKDAVEVDESLESKDKSTLDKD